MELVLDGKVEMRGKHFLRVSALQLVLQFLSPLTTFEVTLTFPYSQMVVLLQWLSHMLFHQLLYTRPSSRRQSPQVALIELEMSGSSSPQSLMLSFLIE